MWTREQYLWWIRQIRADSSISLSPKNKSLRKIKGVTVSASSPSWKLHFLGANCFLAGYYLFTSEIYQRYFWFATARFLVLSLSLSLSRSPLSPCVHVTASTLRATVSPPQSSYSLRPMEGEKGTEFSFFPSVDGDWRFAPENIPPGLDVNGQSRSNTRAKK